MTPFRRARSVAGLARSGRLPLAPILLLLAVAGCLPEEPDATLLIRGGTLIDGTGVDPVADANVVIDGERIVCAGPAAECEARDPLRTLDASGRWITPGLIDAHVHFSQSGWIDARPLTAGRPVDERYEAAIDTLRRNPQRAYRAMLCSGITAVADVGGYGWSVELREGAEADSLAPRIAAAGPLLTFIRYPLVYRGENQMVTLTDSASVRAAVERLAAPQLDFIKLWYIVDPRRGVDSAVARHLARFAAEEVDRRGVPLAVHATGLWEARHAVEIGADVLVHSVFNDPVDDDFLRSARESGVIYTPTVAVREGYIYMRHGAFPRDRHDLRCADPGVVESWARWAAERDEEPGAARRAAEEEILDGQRLTLDNLRRVHAAGIPVATGTDSGNPMTLHGASILREMELMRQGGMTAMDVLVATTRNGARVMGRADELGTLEEGKLADLLVLGDDPLESLDAFERIEWVVRGGVAHLRSDLLPGAD